MRLAVNGTHLWFDVDGPAVVADGDALVRRPTVVLIHGGPGSFDHSYLKPDFGRLAAHAQVVYVDLRGHGRSDWGEPADCTFEVWADDVCALCDALGVEHPIVFGHSMGAPIALLFAVRHPGRASGLIVQSGFARWDPARLVEGYRRVAGDEIAAIAGRSYAGEAVADADGERVFAAFGPHLPDPAREAQVPKNLPLNEHGMDMVRRLDIVAQLGRIDVPALVCVGALDPVTPVPASEEIVAALPAGLGRLEVLEGAGHFTWLDAPDRYWPAVIEFVREAAATAPG